MPDILVFETSPEILEEIRECLAEGDLLARADLHLVLRTTPLEEIIAASGARLVVASWEGIGLAVATAVYVLNPRPALWVVTGYPPERVTGEAPARPDRILDKFDVVGHSRLAGEIRKFLESDDPA